MCASSMPITTGGRRNRQPLEGAGPAAQPAALAPAYVFLTSAESSFVVEETLNVNGGMNTP